MNQEKQLGVNQIVTGGCVLSVLNFFVEIVSFT